MGRVVWGQQFWEKQGDREREQPGEQWGRAPQGMMVALATGACPCSAFQCQTGFVCLGSFWVCLGSFCLELKGQKSASGSAHRCGYVLISVLR